MEKRKYLLTQKLSKPQMIAIFLLNAIAPVAAVWIAKSVEESFPFWEYKNIAILISAILIGIIILLFDLFLILRPLEYLKSQMRNWNRPREEGQFKMNTNDSEISNLFAKIANNHQQYMSREYTMKVLKQQAELMALQSQINPHFLYNTLDSIRGVALINDVPQIADMTEALSKLFRCMIAKEGLMVSLDVELQSVSNYMLIQQIRFSGRIKCKIRVEKELLSYKVPNLIIQPIVENAVIHGLEYKETGGMIYISGYVTNNRLVISVEDDGVGIPRDKLDMLSEKLKETDGIEDFEYERGQRGIALTNSNKRIKLHFGNEYGLSIMSTPNVSTRVEIVLPAI